MVHTARSRSVFQKTREAPGLLDSAYNYARAAELKNSTHAPSIPEPMGAASGPADRQEARDRLSGHARRAGGNLKKPDECCFER
jgi:hypothetical protein